MIEFQKINKKLIKNDGLHGIFKTAGQSQTFEI